MFNTSLTPRRVPPEVPAQASPETGLSLPGEAPVLVSGRGHRRFVLAFPFDQTRAKKTGALEKTDQPGCICGVSHIGDGPPKWEVLWLPVVSTGQEGCKISGKPLQFTRKGWIPTPSPQNELVFPAFCEVLANQG